MGWTDLGPETFLSGPSIVLERGGRLVVFARHDDNTIWHGWQLSRNGDWSPWESLGGEWTSDPAASLNDAGGLYVIARGIDGRLHENWQDRPDGQWSGWEEFAPEVVAGGPSVVLERGGRLVVFANHEDGALWHKWQMTRNGDWSPWESLGGVWTSDPDACLNDPGGLYVVVRDTNNLLYENWQAHADGQWAGWHVFAPEIVTSGPSAVLEQGGRLVVFARREDDAIWLKWQTTRNGGWSAWESLGGTWTSDPGTALNDPGGLYAVARGVDNRLYETWQEHPNGTWFPDRGMWTPTSSLGHAVYEAGFVYDESQDIIYTRMDALQRGFGYAYGYDAAALGINAVLDCEPIFFDYAGKHWMVELWKGQYGLETGCEIGVYTRRIGSGGASFSLLDEAVGRRQGDGVPSHNLFYECASDSDRLEISASLYRDGIRLFTRGPETHWWLTGFRWGVLSDPSQLSVWVSITLKDAAMRDAFMSGIGARPYRNLAVVGTTVSFYFDEPFAIPQPPSPPSILSSVQAANQAIVSAYKAFGFTTNDPNEVEAELLDVLGLGILHLTDHFGLTTAQRAIELGGSASSIVPLLGQAFDVPGSAVEVWVSCASQGFSNWLAEVEGYFGLKLDFSCYVMIDNTRGDSDLSLVTATATHGSYAVSPPSWIPRGGVGRFILQDPKPSPFGSEGTATYTYSDATLVVKTVLFSFFCPTGIAANKAASSQAEWAHVAKSGSPNKPWVTVMPDAGHPIYVAYVIRGGLPSEGRVRRVTNTRKDPRGRITHLCGDAAAIWGPVSLEEAVTQIEGRQISYIAAVGGQYATVNVVNGPHGSYLRTSRDTTASNNLEELPDC